MFMLMTRFSSPSRCVFWFSVDNQLLFTKTLFGVVYIPPENSLYSNIEMFSEIENFLLNIDCDYCLLGDFNSHTGNVKEYTEIDGNILDFCHVPDEERLLLNNLHILDECNVPYLRYSQDKHKIDKYGQRLLDLCKSLGLFFVNGRVGSDRCIGNLTCNNSVIDYVLVTPSMFRAITDFNVLHYDPILSDIHKPVCLKEKVG